MNGGSKLATMTHPALGFLTLPLAGTAARHNASAGERGGSPRLFDETSHAALTAIPDPSAQRGAKKKSQRQRRAKMAVAIAILAFFAHPAQPVHAASNRERPPQGSVAGAPPQYTRFTRAELTRGFMALAFGSDLRIGARPRGIRRFEHPIRARVYAGGSVDRVAEMLAVVEDYARAVPALNLSLAQGAQQADIDIRLIDEKDFRSALEEAFGAKVTREFVARTDPQCMTSVKSTADGDIVRSVSFIIVDKGDQVFFDCAYHELLHAFGLSNHDQRNPFTTLNQGRMVGYLTVYDRSLLRLLYDRRVTPGMSPAQVRALLPQVIKDLGLATSAR